MRKRMEKLAFLLYRLIKPWFAKLEKFVQEEQRKALQAIQYEIAEHLQAKLRERKRNFPEFFKRLVTPPSQDACPHLKGGRLRGPRKDYSVNLHTFVDGSKKITCTICRKKWTPDSPDWENAVSMVEQSTNRPSSSEVPYLRYTDKNRTYEEAQAEGLPTEKD